MRKAYAAYQERCDRAGLVDFAELLLRAHELLRDNPALLAHYRHRFRETAGRRIPGHQRDPVRASCACSPATPATCSWSATTTSRSTAGAAPRSRTCSASCATTPARRPSAWSRTTAPASNILDAANAVIAHNPDRLGKKLWTDTGDGEPIDLYAAYNEMDEARFVVERIRQWVRDGGSHGECAILYRSNAQSRAFEEALLGRADPVPRLRRPALLRARRNQGHAGLPAPGRQSRVDDAAFERAVNTPTRGIGERTLDEVRRARARRRRRAVGSRARASPATARWPRVRAMRWPVSSLLIDALAGEVAALPLHGEDRPRADPQRPARALRQRIARASSIRAPTTSTNWCRWPRASSHGDDEESAAMTRAGRVPQLRRAGSRRRPGPGRRGRRAADDAAQRQGPGVPAGVPGGPGGRPVPERQVARRKPGRLEEERRLAYVGITRARQKLVLSYAETRRIHGIGHVRHAVALPARDPAGAAARSAAARAGVAADVRRAGAARLRPCRDRSARR